MITADRVVFSGGGEPPEFPLRTVAQLRAHGGIGRAVRPIWWTAGSG